MEPKPQHIHTARLRICLACCLAFLLVGCGGGGGSTMPPAQNTGRLNPGVEVLLANDSRQVVASTDDTVTISGDASALAPGTTLVSAQGAGLLRHIDSVEAGSGTTVLHTSAAGLEDVFQEANVQSHSLIGADQVAQFIPAAPGISMQTGHALGMPNGEIGKISLALDNFSLEDSGAGKLTASGTITLSANLDFDFNLGHGSPFCKGVFTLDGSATAEITATLQKTFATKKVLLGTIVAKPFVIFAGAVPIVIVPRFELYSVLNGSVKIGATINPSMHVVATLGGTYENGDFHVSTSLSRSAGLTAIPNFFGSLNFSVAPVHAEASATIYGLLGPYATLDAPRFDLAFLQQISPAGKQISADASIKGVAGLKMRFFGKTILDHEFSDAINVQFHLFDRFYPDNGGVVVGVH